jgi:hemerythrin-like domain-containing protein
MKRSGSRTNRTRPFEERKRIFPAGVRSYYGCAVVRDPELSVTRELVHQHRGLVASLDHAVERGTQAARRVFARAMRRHIDLEEELVYGVLADETREECEGEHAVLRFAVRRFVDAKTKASLVACARVVRDLLIPHLEREERVILPALERQLGRDRSRVLARVLRRRFAPATD